MRAFVITIVVVLAIMVAGVPAIGLARPLPGSDDAQAHSEGFGISLQWTAAWTVTDTLRQIDSTPLIERIVLEQGEAQLTVSLMPTLERDPDTAFESEIKAVQDRLEETLSPIDRIELPGRTLSANLYGSSATVLVEARSLSGYLVTVVVTLEAPPEFFTSALDTASQTVWVESRPVLTDSAAHTEAKKSPRLITGVDGASYSSPTYGYFLTWDSSEWFVSGVWEHQSGNDGLTLTNANYGLLDIQAHRANPDELERCVANEWALYSNPLRAGNIQPVPDAAGDPIAGVTDTGAYGVFSFEFFGQHGESLGPGIGYTECRAFSHDTVMIITFITRTPDTYNADVQEAFEVLSSIAYQGASGPMPTVVAVEDVLIQAVSTP